MVPGATPISASGSLGSAASLTVCGGMPDGVVARAADRGAEQDEQENERPGRSGRCGCAASVPACRRGSFDEPMRRLRLNATRQRLTSVVHLRKRAAMIRNLTLLVMGCRRASRLQPKSRNHRRERRARSDGGRTGQRRAGRAAAGDRRQQDLSLQGQQPGQDRLAGRRQGRQCARRRRHHRDPAESAAPVAEGGNEVAPAPMPD